jgi:probable rRNA maturation factor
VGIILTGDAEIASLNESAMGHVGPTDVLSFPLLEPDDFPPHPGRAPRSRNAPLRRPPAPRGRPHLGEIVVSVERAIEQAASGKGGQTGDVRWDARDELLLLVTHGALHLCGWDHAAPVEEAAMRDLEATLMGSHGLRA